MTLSKVNITPPGSLPLFFMMNTNFSLDVRLPNNIADKHWTDSIPLSDV
jgi:hypothetical protein